MAIESWLDSVKRVLEHVNASDATELQIERPGFRLQVRRRLNARPRARGSLIDRVDGATGVPVVAPLTGVFYRSSSPGTPPYVNEGDLVQPDTVIGLIETMKIFNEVLAERRGWVRRIVAEAGQLVHAGDPLMLIEESAEEAAERVDS